MIRNVKQTRLPHPAGMTVPEVAAALGISVRSVYLIEQKAMRKLRRLAAAGVLNDVAPSVLDHVGAIETSALNGLDGLELETI